ncbi:MAG: winged helix-turn-helix domain-containing protein [Methyloprofundus sp.]|nr:winged helix-turn-helix domain-containing protein [Methyloprofundus sp.]MDT8425580.1 winged helix-turn-helix domain-containing protein [Methyloprofundus sp.]
MKKPIITAAKPVAKVKENTPVVTATITPVVAKTAPTKPVPAKKTPTKIKAAAPKTVVTEVPSLTMIERVGLTSGSIWHYLTDNGATSVSALVKALTEEEKIIQRSIGWLAQEGKITLETVGRVENIALKK